MHDPDVVETSEKVYFPNTVTVEYNGVKKISACPFCGSNELILLYNSMRHYYVYCTFCTADGPAKMNMDEAIDDWNKAKMVITYDLTNELLGNKVNIYESDLVICPLCNRVGKHMQSLQLTNHVVTVVDGGIWVSDVCDLGENKWTIAEPARSLENRVKHPWELQSND